VCCYRYNAQSREIFRRNRGGRAGSTLQENRELIPGRLRFSPASQTRCGGTTKQGLLDAVDRRGLACAGYGKNGVEICGVNGVNRYCFVLFCFVSLLSRRDCLTQVLDHEQENRGKNGAWKTGNYSGITVLSRRGGMHRQYLESRFV
jgi:hypothetical protein